MNCEKKSRLLRLVFVNLLVVVCLIAGAATSAAAETGTSAAVCRQGLDEKGRLSFETLYSLAADVEEDEQTSRGFCLRYLVPSESRWFRGLSFSYSGLDQPNTLFDSMGNPTPNPDAELKKYEASLDLALVSWSTDELVAAYQLAAGTDTGSLVSARGFDTRFVGSEDPLRFFARAGQGKKDRLRRFAAAWKFSTAQSERKNVGVRGDDYEDTYKVSFDPKKFIISTDRALAAYKGLEAYAKVHDVASGLQPVSLRDDPVRVLHEASGLPVMHQVKVALIPTIEWSTVDQFDFLAVGSLFEPNPLLEESIETFKVTWNFSAALDTTAKRRSAVSAIALHNKIVKQDARGILPAQLGKPEKFCVGDFVHRQFSVKGRPAVSDGQWSAADLPRGLSMQRNGLLVGWFKEASNQTFSVTVDGKVKKGTEMEKPESVTERRQVVVVDCG